LALAFNNIPQCLTSLPQSVAAVPICVCAEVYALTHPEFNKI